MLYYPVEQTSAEYLERRSRFIAVILPFEKPPLAKQVAKVISLEHPQADHVAFAFRCGSEKSTTMGQSDAGEPKGTAGKPILDLIIGNSLTNIFIAVVRYFGGIKLGTGGLVHAYSSAAKEAISTLVKKPFVVTIRIILNCSYETYQPIRMTIAGLLHNLISEEFKENITLIFEVDIRNLQTLETIISDKWGKEKEAGIVRLFRETL